MLWNNIKLECRKAIFTKLFIFVVILGCIITMSSFAYRLRSYYNDLNNFKMIEEEGSSGIVNPMTPIETLFNHWIGSEAVSAGSVYYYFLFPILVCIPYGWSYCRERRSGYIKNVVIRTGKWGYYLSKCIALFLSGGLVMVVPLLFNFVLTAMFIPAVTPDPYYITGYGIIPVSFLSEVFYTQPFLYVFLYLLVDFIYGGLVACMCFAFSAFVRHHVVAMLLPFATLIGFDYMCNSFVYISSNKVYTEISPIYFLRPAPAAYNTNSTVIFMGMAILFLFTLAVVVMKGALSEVY